MKASFNQNNKFVLSSFLLLVVLLTVTFSVFAKNADGCSDFLKGWGFVNNGLHYLSCEKKDKTPAVVLQSIYKISGKNAKDLESVLIKKFGMKKLRFVCCYFEGRPVSYIDNIGNSYEIQMYSDEITSDQNVYKWEDIPFFNVIVDKYIELP